MNDKQAHTPNNCPRCKTFDAMREALQRIQEKSKPGQTFTPDELADIVCEIWHDASQALSGEKGGNK